MYISQHSTGPTSECRSRAVMRQLLVSTILIMLFSDFLYRIAVPPKGLPTSILEEVSTAEEPTPKKS